MQQQKTSALTKLTAIVGLGKTGLSIARFLAKQQCPFFVMDSRNEPPGLAELLEEFPETTTYLGTFVSVPLLQAQQLIVSPGISLHEPAIAEAIAAGIVAIGDIELFAQQIAVPVIAITGTNGKSTVTTLVGEMAKQADKKVGVGGNLGTPVLELINAETELYVLELSSFQLETTYTLAPIAATVLNISPDHMDRYATLQDYIDAKQRIFNHCQTAIINREDLASFSGLKQINGAISFGLDEPKANQFGLRFAAGETFLAYGEQNLLSTQQLKIKGRHQNANALAALALGHAANLPMAAMLKTLTVFEGLVHRCQWVAAIAEVDWYNDSKGTNVNSTLAAITGLGSVIAGKLILIAGGQSKQQDFSPLRGPAKEYVREVILLGEDANQIGKALENSVKITYVPDMATAVKQAKNAAQPHDAVLLSPACASFDMFKNFEHRGEVFMELVKNIK